MLFGLGDNIGEDDRWFQGVHTQDTGGSHEWSVCVERSQSGEVDESISEKSQFDGSGASRGVQRMTNQ